MKTNLKILILLLFLFGCTKTEDIPEAFVISGDYSGTFGRTNIKMGWCCNSEVTFSFTDSTFAGSSEQQYFPAICAGDIANVGRHDEVAILSIKRFFNIFIIQLLFCTFRTVFIIYLNLSVKILIFKLQ